MPRAQSGTRVARRWLGFSLLCGLLIVLAAPAARAHPAASSALLLDTSGIRPTGTLQLPISQLAIALQQPCTSASVMEKAKLEELRRYVRAHAAIASRASGAEWNVAVEGGMVQAVDGIDHLVFELKFEPPSDGDAKDFNLTYDGIQHHLLSHQVFVLLRSTHAGEYRPLGMLDWQVHSITVPFSGVSAQHGFVAAVGLGIRHIAAGADHLLFLFMLLLPAPLIVSQGRWRTTNNLSRSLLRVVQVVTAFTVGHSSTLALAGLGYIQAPARWVECCIAVSIAVSALHAIKPAIAGGEALIAVAFGLVHGLAFAALLGELGVGQQSLIAVLFGFNLGIELTQLMVVALLMPSLLLLSRTPYYAFARISGAVFGLVLASAWLLERLSVISANPLNAVADAVTDSPFVVPLGLAMVSVGCWIHVHQRRAAAD